MSYILDALKRAESERLGAAVHTPLPSSFAAPRAARRRLPAARWMLPLAGGLALGALLLNFMAEPGPQVEAETVPAQAAAAAAAAPAAVQAPILPPALPAVSPPRAAVAPAPHPAPRATRAGTVPAPSARPAQATAPAAPEALGTLRELPEHIQREIPPLVIGGYLYSTVPADRTVLIDKRLRREGDEVAPGLVIETLQPNGMVLNYRGHRYRSTY